MKLSKETKTLIRSQLESIASSMASEEDPTKLRALAERYKEVSGLLKVNWNISPDTVLIVCGNLLGIILILKYEQLDIITTKALGFVLRGRV